MVLEKKGAHQLRSRLDHSLVSAGVPLGLLRELNLVGLRKFAANWVRLILLVSFCNPISASATGFSGLHHRLAWCLCV